MGSWEELGEAPSVKTPRRLCRFTATTSDWKARGIEAEQPRPPTRRSPNERTTSGKPKFDIFVGSSFARRPHQTSLPSPWSGQSTPAERPGGYQPDFLTAHVKSASQMLAPRPAHVPPASGPTSQGWHRQHRWTPKRKSAAGDLVEEPCTKFAGASAYGADTFMNAHVQQLHEREERAAPRSANQRLATTRG